MESRDWILTKVRLEAQFLTGRRTVTKGFREGGPFWIGEAQSSSVKHRRGQAQPDLCSVNRRKATGSRKNTLRVLENTVSYVYSIIKSRPVFRVIIQIRLVAHILAWIHHHVRKLPYRQSVHPLKVEPRVLQPLLPRRAAYFAVVHLTLNLWQVPLVLLPFHIKSYHASLHGPVDLHPTRHDLLIHLSTHPTVPAGNQHSQ